MPVGSEAVKIAETYSFCVALRPNLGRNATQKVLRCLDHTQVDKNTRYDASVRMIRGGYLHSTQQNKETSICALNEIRTSNPSHQMAAYLGLRPHGPETYKKGKALP